jgi:hypothetical protein
VGSIHKYHFHDGELKKKKKKPTLCARVLCVDYSQKTIYLSSLPHLIADFGAHLRLDASSPSFLSLALFSPANEYHVGGPAGGVVKYGDKFKAKVPFDLCIFFFSAVLLTVRRIGDGSPQWQHWRATDL